MGIGVGRSMPPKTIAPSYKNTVSPAPWAGAAILRPATTTSGPFAGHPQLLRNPVGAERAQAVGAVVGYAVCRFW